jgi:hypothetical protein
MLFLINDHSYEHYFLSFLQAVVAEVKNTAVGLMSLTADLDVRILQKCFELHAYDNLLRVDSEVSVCTLKYGYVWSLFLPRLV